MPHTEYCSVVYSYGLNSFSKALLDRAFGLIIRYVYGVKKFESIRIYVDKLLGFSLSKFFTLRAMLFIHKLIKTKSPGYLKFLINMGASMRTMHLRTPRCSNVYGSTLAVRGVADWNTLPIIIRTTTPSKEKEMVRGM